VRTTESETSEAGTAALAQQAGPSDGAAGLPDLKRLKMLLKRANEGDKDAVAQICEAVRDNKEFWRQVGDLGRITLQVQLKVMYGEDLVLQNGIQRCLAAMREELLSPESTPLESLLVDRIVACWLQVQYADGIYAQRMENLDIRWNELYQKRQDRAHRRFVSACKALATVRKLAAPVLQVNIGEKQVNVAQMGVGTQSPE
jgi:hypothetical protein